MKYNNFWKLMGVSLICITVFGVSNANAKTTTMFTFTVDKPVNGQDACAPRVYNQQGTGEYADCYRIVSVPQIVGSNGTCIDDPNLDGASSASDWICPGAPGASCNIVSSEKSNGRSTINLKCGTDPVTTLEIDDGAAGQNGQDGKVCNTTVSRNASTGKTLITATCDGQPSQTAEIDEDAIATNTVNKIKDDNTVALKEDISDFQTASDVNTLISNATTKDMLKQKLDGEYLSEVPNTYALKTDLPDVTGFQTASDVNTLISNATTKDMLKQKLDGEYLSEVPNTYALKTDLPDVTGFQTASDVNTLISNATTKDMLKQKLDGEYLTGIPNTVAMKDDLNGYVTTSDSGDNSIGKILESNNVITTSNLSQNNIVTTGTLGNAVTNAIAQDSTIVKTTDNGYKEIQAQAAGALQANDVNQNYLVDKLGNAYVTPGGLNTAVSSAIANDSTIVKTTDADYKAIQDQVAGALQANNIGTCTTTSTAERTSTTCTGAMATIFNQLKEAINVAATGKQQQ